MSVCVCVCVGGGGGSHAKGSHAGHSTVCVCVHGSCFPRTCTRARIRAPSPPTNAQVLRHTQLTRYRLQRIVSTREADLLSPAPPPTLAALEAYGEGTSSQLLQLQLEAAGVASTEAGAAAASLGKAVGIVTLLRGTLYHAKRWVGCGVWRACV